MVRLVVDRKAWIACQWGTRGGAESYPIQMSALAIHRKTKHFFALLSYRVSLWLPNR